MLGGLAGFAGVRDDADWTSDTMVGVALGFAVGKGVVARRFRRRTEPKPTVQVVLRVRF